MAESADRLARRLGVNRSQLVQRALLEYFKGRSQAGVTGALNAVYAEDPAAGRVDPLLANLQGASLPRGDWC